MLCSASEHYVNTMGGTGKPYAELEAGAAGMIRRATANGASPMHFMLSMGSFVALWAYLALSPSEEGFFLREFVRFEIPEPRVNHRGTGVAYGLGYGAAMIWLASYVWVSTMRASMVRGFFMAWVVMATSMTVVIGGGEFLFEAGKIANNVYESNGHSVFNVMAIAVGTVVGVGLAFAVLAVVANGITGSRDQDL